MLGVSKPGVKRGGKREGIILNEGIKGRGLNVGHV